MSELRFRLIEHFADGEGFKSITSARKWASELTANRYDPGTPNAKALEETIEESVVAVGRQIVRSSDNPILCFDQLLDLYQRQPILGTRSSGSVERQAYYYVIILKLTESDKNANPVKLATYPQRSQLLAISSKLG